MKAPAIAIGTQISASPARPAKRSGATPTTVIGTRLIWMARPTMERSPPKRRFQSPSEITATACAPGAPSSSAENVRPSAAPTPSVGKYDADTISATSRSGSATPVRFRSTRECAATDSNERAWRRRLSNLGKDHGKVSAGVFPSRCVIATVMRESGSR
jgi:hypothetical protein